MTDVFARIQTIYDRMHWFTDKEAWALFRLFAFGEAIGWTLLIGAIIYRSNNLPGADIAIRMAGSIHGLFFVLYFLFVFLTARSMQWSFRRVAIALIAGMPPYTSVIFEQAIARQRKKHPVYVEPPKDID